MHALGERTGRHLSPDANQQGVAQPAPQPPQCVAHRGLRDPHLTRGLGDTVESEHHVEIDEQIEVEATQRSDVIMNRGHIHMKDTTLGS